MKKLLVIMLALGSVSLFAEEASVVKCWAKIDRKLESMKIKVNDRGELMFWSKSKIVDASRNSYFSALADLKNFGLEGSNNFFTPNGYSVMNVMNTAESIFIGVDKTLTKGFYSYRDAGSGLGNSRFALTCKLVNN